MKLNYALILIILFSLLVFGCFKSEREQLVHANKLNISEGQDSWVITKPQMSIDVGKSDSARIGIHVTKDDNSHYSIVIYRDINGILVCGVVSETLNKDGSHEKFKSQSDVGLLGNFKETVK